MPAITGPWRVHRPPRAMCAGGTHRRPAGSAVSFWGSIADGDSGFCAGRTAGAYSVEVRRLSRVAVYARGMSLHFGELRAAGALKLRM